MLLAIAASVWGFGTPNFDGWPPQRFTRNPIATVKFENHNQIVKDCADQPVPTQDDEAIEACSFGNPNTIIMPNPCTFRQTDEYARLLCHEIGHLNGWPADHPK